MIQSNRPRDRVLVIGPTSPYRGGIAQHTTLLHRTLREQCECLTISFTRQYPRWLFPGKSDIDPNVAGHVEEGVEFLIDSINPLSWSKALSRARIFGPQLVVFPWWHVYWAPCFAWLSSKLKEDGVEVVFLCHNVIEHESARWKRVVTDFVLSKGSRFVVHTSVDKENLLNRFSESRVAIYPLPVFDQFPMPSEDFPRRAKLELLFFGFVRPYKGLDVLLQAMARLAGEDVFLSVVGEFWRGEDEARKYVADNKLASNVEIVSRYVSDDEAASFFSRCDVVVLPYRSATGSGVIPLAYHYGKSVIATRVGGLPDAVEEGKTGLLVDPDSIDQLSGAIKQVLAGRNISRAEAISEFKNRVTWRGLVNVVLGG